MFCFVFNRLLNSRTAQQQQQITPSAVVAALNNSFQQMAPQQPSSQTVTPLPHRHQQVSPLGQLIKNEHFCVMRHFIQLFST